LELAILIVPKSQSACIFLENQTLSLPGGLSGSLLEFGGIAVSCVEFDSATVL
jgi:hypothetical protein